MINETHLAGWMDSVSSAINNVVNNNTNQLKFYSPIINVLIYLVIFLMINVWKQERKIKKIEKELSGEKDCSEVKKK